MKKTTTRNLLSKNNRDSGAVEKMSQISSLTSYFPQNKSVLLVRRPVHRSFGEGGSLLACGEAESVSNFLFSATSAFPVA